jgi:two-component system sensor histidine kinase CpxA
MRSLYVRILLWCLLTLLLSLAAFFPITTSVSRRAVGHGGLIADIHAWQAEEAAAVYASGGGRALSAYMARLHRFVREDDYFTDAQGRDLLTGEDRSALLTLSPSASGVGQQVNGRLVMVTASANGRYRMIVVAPPPIGIQSLFPYFFLILLAVALVCWLLALNIATPLRDLAKTVDRFGRGELDVRLKSRRRDEIGELSRSFDAMAERIGTLLTAERRLLQDVSHELRSPLARLSLAAELIETSGDRHIAVARLKKEIERLTSLVATLVEVTRAETDPSAGRLEHLVLGDLLRDIVDDCRLEADGRRCSIGIKGDLALEFDGDRELLRRAMENVVRNAIRHTPEGTAVEVNIENTRRAARSCVRDAGPGVPDELLQKIFQPFFRADDSRDSSTGGVGLGLAIAYRAVSIHHGHLWAENGSPGLKVWIELPLAS